MESNEASVALRHVWWDEVYGIWPVLYKGVVTYNEKSPHKIESPEAVLRNLSSEDGDRLVLITCDNKYAGFITYKLIELEGETCAALAMIYADEEEFRGRDVLKEAVELLRRFFYAVGCKRMSFFTARHGFRKLAPRLGFKPRIVEWTMEVDQWQSEPGQLS